ncbi:hypothetical protein HK101_010500 [Irineochytrium annulatum]|nr:hypothetical protein HK101_010500 [Irineochytrium annulatum]
MTDPNRPFIVATDPTPQSDGPQAPLTPTDEIRKLAGNHPSTSTLGADPLFASASYSVMSQETAVSQGSLLRSHPVHRPPSQLEELKSAAGSLVRSIPTQAPLYVKSLFPIASWLPRYNTTWLTGDLIAGLTVGLVVIPQAIAYSTKLAGLPAQYGLYTSFVGVLLYSPFATSKDVTIGPTSVLSLLVGQTIASYDSADTTSGKIVFALTLSFFTGLIQLFLGLVRLGIFIDFVPVSVISGFTTGAGLQIIIGQLPTLLGIKGIDTNAPPYLVLGNWLKALPNIPTSKNDVAFGLLSLAIILTIKYATQPFAKRNIYLRYLNYLRNGIVVILFTAISFALRNHLVPAITIVGTVPIGFQSIPKPNLTSDYVGSVLRALPAVLIVSILEHVAVTKSYGRLNGYRPDDNQELVAIGLTNLIGSFVGAYPATGSFSRSAIKSASGVRTPLATLFTGIIVLISIYALTPAFYFIPNAVLASVIIGAITELFASPRVVQSLWNTQLIDFAAFLLALLVTFFSSIENAIYASVAFALLVLVIRIARPSVRTLVRSTATGAWVDAEGGYVRSRPDEKLQEAPEGILVFRADESMTYPNAGFLLRRFRDHVVGRYRYSGPAVSKGDRSWSDDTEERVRKQQGSSAAQLPELKAVVFDFSSVNHVDYTGLQTLLDTREDLARFAGRDVPFYFAHVRISHLRVLWTVVEGDATAAGVDVGPGCNPAEEKERRDERAGRRFYETVDEAVQEAERDARWKGGVTRAVDANPALTAVPEVDVRVA